VLKASFSMLRLEESLGSHGQDVLPGARPGAPVASRP
jgi:hypothetical protein